MDPCAHHCRPRRTVVMRYLTVRRYPHRPAPRSRRWERVWVHNSLVAGAPDWQFGAGRLWRCILRFSCPACINRVGSCVCVDMGANAGVGVAVMSTVPLSLTSGFEGCIAASIRAWWRWRRR